MTKENTPEERICELESKYDTQWKVIGVFITIFISKNYANI